MPALLLAVLNQVDTIMPVLSRDRGTFKVTIHFDKKPAKGKVFKKAARNGLKVTGAAVIDTPYHDFGSHNVTKAFCKKLGAPYGIFNASNPKGFVIINKAAAEMRDRYVKVATKMLPRMKVKVDVKKHGTLQVTKNAIAKLVAHYGDASDSSDDSDDSKDSDDGSGSDSDSSKSSKSSKSCKSDDCDDAVKVWRTPSRTPPTSMPSPPARRLTHLVSRAGRGR